MAAPLHFDIFIHLNVRATLSKERQTLFSVIGLSNADFCSEKGDVPDEKKKKTYGMVEYN